MATSGISSDFDKILLHWDGLCRYSKSLEEECDTYNNNLLIFAESFERMRKRLLSSRDEMKCMKEELDIVKNEKQALFIRLEHARKQLELEGQKRDIVEREFKEMEQKLELVRTVLAPNITSLNEKDRKTLSFLSQQKPKRKTLEPIEESQSLLSDSNFDVSDEDEGPDVRAVKSPLVICHPATSSTDEDGIPPRKRVSPSAPPLEDEDFGVVKKRSKITEDTVTISNKVETVRGYTLTSDSARNAARRLSAGQRKRRRPSRELLQRIVDESETSDDFWSDEMPMRPPTGIMKPSPSTPILSQEQKEGTPYSSPALRKVNSASTPSTPSFDRNHQFLEKTVLKPETCSVCDKRIPFGRSAFKCKHCLVACHPQCKLQAPMPCVPMAVTPNGSKLNGYLADYCPKLPPCVPALLVHCVKEIDGRGLKSKGLYREAGSAREIKEVKEKFYRNQAAPNLSKINDINTVCGVMKDFLLKLKEPIIPTRMWSRFVQASALEGDRERDEAVKAAVYDMPLANRDTLAFIIQHLQRVSASPDCCMPITNLARVFGPTLVGYSVSEPLPTRMIEENSKQRSVVEALLTLSGEFWSQFVGAPPASDRATILGRGLMSSRYSQAGPVFDNPFRK